MDWDPKIGWANLIAVTLFVAGYFVRWAIEAHERRKQRRNFFVALFTEIGLNVT